MKSNYSLSLSGWGQTVRFLCRWVLISEWLQVRLIAKPAAAVLNRIDPQWPHPVPLWGGDYRCPRCWSLSSPCGGLSVCVCVCVCVCPNHPITFLIGLNYDTSEKSILLQLIAERQQYISVVTLTNDVVLQHPFLEMAEPRSTLTALILAAKEAMRNHR